MHTVVDYLRDKLMPLGLVALVLFLTSCGWITSPDFATIENLINQQKYVTALKRLHDITASSPRNIKAWDLKGEIYLDQERYNEAGRVFEKISEINPDHPAGLRGQARLELLDGSTGKALKKINRALEYDTQNADVYFTASQVYYEMEAYEKTREKLNQALEIEPNHNRSLVEKSFFAFVDDNEDSGEQYISRALENNNNGPRLFFWVGEIYYHLGYFDKAREHLKKAINKGVYQADSYHYLGRMSLENDEYEQALGHFKEAVRYEPFNGAILTDLGFTHYTMGNYDQADKKYDRSITVDSAFSDAYLEKADLMKQMGYYEEAAHFYREYLLFEPRDDEAYNNLGEVYLDGFNEPEQAIIHFRNALRNDPDTLLPLLNYADSYLAMGEVETARSLYEQVVEVGEEDNPYVDAAQQMLNEI